MSARPTPVLIRYSGSTFAVRPDYATEAAVARGVFAADGYTYSTGSARTSVSVAGQILSPDRTVDDPVHTTDLLATIVRIEGLVNATGVESVSSLPYLRSTSAAPQHETVYTEQFESGSGTAAIRNDRWKLIADVTYPDPTSDCAADFSYEVTGFYDLENDPHELDDLLGDSSADMTEAPNLVGGSTHERRMPVTPAWLTAVVLQRLVVACFCPRS